MFISTLVDIAAFKAEGASETVVASHISYLLTLSSCTFVNSFLHSIDAADNVFTSLFPELVATT